VDIVKHQQTAAALTRELFSFSSLEHWPGRPAGYRLPGYRSPGYRLPGYRLGWHAVVQMLKDDHDN